MPDRTQSNPDLGKCISEINRLRRLLVVLGLIATVIAASTYWLGYDAARDAVSGSSAEITAAEQAPVGAGLESAK